MATKENKGAENAENKGAENKGAKVNVWVDDSNAVTLSDGQERRYWSVEAGSVIAGDVLDLVSMMDEEEGRERQYLLIETTRPCEVKEARNPQAFTVEAGSFVYVNVRHDLAALLNYTGGSHIPRVQIQATDKVSIGGGKSVWRFRYTVKPSGRRKLPLSRALPPTVGRPGDETPPDSDIPF